MGKILFRNGNIITLDDFDNVYSSLLIENGVILAVGDDPDSFLLSPETKQIDLKEKTIIPGFNDNHIHLNFLGESLEALDFSGMNEEMILNALKKKYVNPGKKQVITGNGWDYPACKAPDKKVLDSLFPNNPVILTQYGGHAYWVNSETLSRMGINRNTPDSQEGIFCRDEDGEPTGIIKDLQRNKFLEKIFIGKLISFKWNLSNYNKSLMICRRYGITSLQDNTWSFIALRVIKKLFRSGKLSARITSWSFGEAPFFRFLFNLGRFGNGFCKRGPVKYFIDGTFTTRTAWLNEAYEGEPENFGHGKSKEQLKIILEKEIKRKHQAAFHAIGDKAVSAFLDALDELSERYTHIPNLRFRLEHAQLIDPADFPRLLKHGILICAQPSALNNPLKDRKILGEERAEKAYPFKSLILKGIPLSFGSDAPGESTVNPFESIHFAVNRKGREKINIEEALRCYTKGSAYAEFAEEKKGCLLPGMLADFLILSENPIVVQPERIREIQVLQTWLNGECISLPNEANEGL